MNLYITSLKEIEKLSEEFCRLHFPKRFEKALKFRKREDYLRSIGAGALLYKVLQISEDQILKDEHQKPYLKDSKMQFNISHSGNYVLLGIGEEELGVDIELMDPEHLQLSNDVFTQDELEWMQNAPLKSFYTLWTLKESIMKQQGVGLSLAPKTFSVLPAIQNGKLWINKKWLYCKTSEYDNHILSLCSNCPIQNMDIHFITF